MQYSYVNYHSRKTCAVSWAIPHHSMSMGQLWGALVPQGYNLYPLRGMFSHSLIASSNVVIHMFLRNSRSELRLVKVGRNVKSMGFSADFSPPVRLSYARSLIKDIAHHSSIGRTI